ncbi:MAG TPA: xanthine dehydrogenase family protein molybdopterin-binding subunit [Acidimicrobiia bacterium]|nr:xanthine dehydrogenase family protein molybdopterin-binding subunit [Acidimicrobiia bacterium]
MTGTSILGHPVQRLEDPPILSGDARYVADLELPGAATAVFVRSTMAHARLVGVGTDTAAKMPGVVGIYTAEDLGLPDIPAFAMAPPVMSRPPLARGTVRCVGEPIAVVVAETAAQAVDAAGEVVVDYEPLPVVADAEAALADAAPLLYPDHGSNLVAEFDFGRTPDIFDGADTVVTARIRNQRLAPVPLEVNGAVAVPGSGPDGTSDRLVLWVSNQHPFGVRDPLAGVLGLPQENIRVVCPAVGGGFGAKIGLYAEYAVIAAAARRLGRPVRWVETRSESMTALVHGRGQIQDLEIGAKVDGTIVGLRGHVIADVGAYPGIATFLPTLTRMMSSGVYAIPKIDVRCSVAVTNTTAVGAYRGAGRPEAAALIERAVDMVAAELALDPVEVRRKNLIPPFDAPHTTAVGATYDVGDYRRALDEVVRLAGYDDLRAEQRRRRDRGDRIALGIGVSTYVEVTGAGPVPEFGSVEVHPDGRVTAQTGTSPHGQGHETAFAQIVSATLGVPMEKVKLLHSDTDAVPEGQGTYGSRSLQLGGSSILVAAEQVLRMARERAANLLEANPDDVVLFEDGRFGVAGTPARSLGWEELAGDGQEPLRAEAKHAQSAQTYPFGAHVAVVEVDTETGAVHLLRMVAVDDCGRVLNPLLAGGQVHGGLAQGIAQALFEEMAYDEDGTPLTATLADYLVPSAAELPSYETAHTETPTPLNPLGAKGIGESGTIGSTPAVQNAVVDALAHLGVRHVDMPCTPERVWRAIQAARLGSAT